MSVRLGIAALVFLMIQTVLFGIGTVLVLATPLKEQAMLLMPAVVVSSFVAAVPFSWWFAPRLRARFWRHRRHPSAADRLLAELS